MTDRDRHIETDRETDRQRERQTDRERERDRQRERERERQRGREAERQRDRETDRQTDSLTDSLTDLTGLFAISGLGCRSFRDVCLRFSSRYSDSFRSMFQSNVRRQIAENPF